MTLSKKFKTLLVASGAALLTACITVPDAVVKRTVDADHDASTALTCHTRTSDHVVASHDAPAPKRLDADGFRLLNWNAFKGDRADWLRAFAAYSGEQDLVTLQEAYLTDDFRAQLRQGGLQWDLATTFLKQQHETGVMTLSRVTPDHVCVQRTMEPWLSLPKSTLISRFPLKGSNRSLLVANIHAVNFTLGTGAFHSQLKQLAHALEEHDGPIILAGDFNTWNDSRIRVLEQTLIDPLSLDKVPFDPTHLKTVFEHNLDYVFFRGLQVVAKDAHDTTASDHNPMWVTFKASAPGKD
jgi:endonuclease/exonuclease/phosphatase (EEP) superfamily protein YafD